MTTLDDLKTSLSAAQEKVKGLLLRWRNEDVKTEIGIAYREMYEAERALAIAQNEETAIAIEWQPIWDIGAPLPHVLASDNGIFLVYLPRDIDPNWDGSYVNVVSPNNSTEPAVLVEFQYPASVKFGAPNDEVLEGHPLHRKGLEGYTAHKVINSQWIKELEKINSVHRMYKKENWQNLTHYLLPFHDTTFECVARGHSIELISGGLKAAVQIALERMWK